MTEPPETISDRSDMAFPITWENFVERFVRSFIDTEEYRAANEEAHKNGRVMHLQAERAIEFVTGMKLSVTSSDPERPAVFHTGCPAIISGFASDEDAVLFRLKYL